MEHKTQINETNHMRKLMGLDLLKEGISAPLGKDENSMNEVEKAQKMAEERALKEKEVKEGHYIDEDGIDIGTGIEGNYSDSESEEDEDIAGAPESEPALKRLDKDEIFEDSEGEETYNYGEDEGHDKEEEHHLEDEEEMAPADHIKAIEGHLDALKDDMGYDEDHEDREEEDTHFAESKKMKRGKKVIKITEADLNTIVKRVIREDDDWMQDADADIEKRGTEGVFHKFCVDAGFEDGCSKGCWDKAKEKGGVWGRRAGLAKAFCESKH
tara:strand:+ start:465 stop:1274 length:810 start_codon:yes stop_codon:yes gene_type:complete